MKRFFPLIIVAAIVLMVLGALVPDFQISQQPLNKLITGAKANGFAVGVVVSDSAAQARIAAEIDKVEKILQRKVFTKYFMGDEGAAFAKDQGLGAAGFVVLDGDGNIGNRYNGELKSKLLVSVISQLHTH